MPSFTSDVIKQTEQQNIIFSYATLMKELYEFDIYLP
jgi:hypothetical protein